MKNDLKTEFEKYAFEGYIGDPAGDGAYAYLRASSEKQVEEGSSFSRQIENVHKTAKRDHLRVTFDMIFFDDGFTGFEFEHRPALMKLRHEAKAGPRASHIVVEDIDRLSRNADWQQGYLLEEFARRNMRFHFWINPGSQLERYVRGYIAQEGMKKDMERMRMGNIHKAMDGKITAKRARYGYEKTHSKNTYYVLHPEESKVVRWMYERLIYDGWTLPQIAKEMNDEGVPTRFKQSFWSAATIYQMLRSTVYKGEFYAHRVVIAKTGEFTASGKPRQRSYVRPESEWIKVDCPSIVTADEWETAQEVMRRNAKKSTRNYRRRNWLLAGIVKCWQCRDEGYAFVSVFGGSPNKPIRYYKCSSTASERARSLQIRCHSPFVRADDLERRVWEELEKVVYDPGIVIRRLEEKEKEERKTGYADQITYMDAQLAELVKEKEKFEAAYKRDIYSLDEFEEKMKDLSARTKTLTNSKAKLKAKLDETHSIEEQKRVVIEALTRVRKEIEEAKKDRKMPNDIPYDLKRKIIVLLADVIWVDTKTGRFTIEGEIEGTFALDDGNKDGTSMDSARKDEAGEGDDEGKSKRKGLEKGKSSGKSNGSGPDAYNYDPDGSDGVTLQAKHNPKSRNVNTGTPIYGGQNDEFALSSGATISQSSSGFSPPSRLVLWGGGARSS